MKNILLFIFAITISPFLMGQQMENASFEDWEDAGTVIDEPVDWSSIKTSDAGSVINGFAPVVWGQSDDAHSGNYSLELTNVAAIAGIIATGTITNGRVHAAIVTADADSHTDTEDPRWNTPLTDRPDSVAIWIKYFPASDQDTAQVKLLLHKGEGSIPPKPENIANEIGFAQINVWEETDTWTRVAASFTYFSNENPEFVLAILTSGAGLFPIEGSIAYYDDIELVYDPSGVNDLSLDNSLIYTSGKTIYLDKLPMEYQNSSQIELIGINGATVWSSEVNSSRVTVRDGRIKQGLYIVRVSSEQGTYVQKIQLR